MNVQRQLSLICCQLLLVSLPLFAQEAAQDKSTTSADNTNNTVQIDEHVRPSVNQLREIAKTIKGCPRAIASESRWGKHPDEIERWYFGPPQNVTWDVAPSKSVRSPYIGYIEFSLPETHWVPESLVDKFNQSAAGTAYVLVEGSIAGTHMRYRYEFDLGPDGLELAKMVRHGLDAQGHYPKEWVDFETGRQGYACWEQAAQHFESKN